MTHLVPVQYVEFEHNPLLISAGWAVGGIFQLQAFNPIHSRARFVTTRLNNLLVTVLKYKGSLAVVEVLKTFNMSNC